MLRLKLILLFIITTLSGHSTLHFTYSITGEEASERTWVKIKKALINNNGWDWYVERFTTRSCILDISLIKDSDKYSMIIATWKAQDREFCNRLAESVNTLAQTNDTVFIDRLTLNIGKLPITSRFDKIPPDIDNLISVEQKYWLTYCVNEFLFCYSVWHGVWYNAFPLSDNSLCQNLFYKGFRLTISNSFISDPTIRDEYIKECMDKNIPCILDEKASKVSSRNHTTVVNNSPIYEDNAKELLRKYVEKNDSAVLNKPVPERRYIMKFKFKPVELDRNNSFTNLR